MIDAGTVVAAAGVVVSVVVPMAGFFIHMDRRITRMETMLGRVLEARELQAEETAWRRPAPVAAWRR